jgi:predicted DNA binding CopG/RHH family protein
LLAARERSILQRHTRNLSVRFDLDTLNRLRTVAKKKGVGYQTLLKQFVHERLYDEEKREGLIGGRSS